MKRIIFHIGHEKTATTSIQFTFKNNHELLLESGYFYPLLDRLEHHNRLFILLFKENLQENERLLLEQDIDVSWCGRIEKYRRWLIQDLLNTAADTIIFSGEYFPNFSEYELKKIYDFFKEIFPSVKYEIYMYARDPVSYAASAYQQRARLFPSDDKVSFFLYKEKIEKFIGVFGFGNIHLYKFEDACRDRNGPVSFLCEKMRVPDGVLGEIQWCRENDSTSVLAVDMLLYINTRMPYTQLNMKKGLRKRRDVWGFHSLPGDKYQIDRVARGKVMEKTQTQVEWLKDSFEIQYSYVEKDVADSHAIVFSDAYAQKLILVLRTVNPVMRKLVYEYIQEKSNEIKIGEEGEMHIRTLLLHFKKNYPSTIRLPYYCLSAPQRLRVLMERSSKHRRLKRVIGKMKRRLLAPISRSGEFRIPK
ncbi:MAG: hypothetical protein HRT90_11160 [Candidatus Margulisbacteria bacterium]|nr:hypothetical protein [Candidatus Margulisiibacteriota bacterium]